MTATCPRTSVDPAGDLRDATSDASAASYRRDSQVQRQSQDSSTFEPSARLSKSRKARQEMPAREPINVRKAT